MSPYFYQNAAKNTNISSNMQIVTIQTHMFETNKIQTKSRFQSMKTRSFRLDNRQSFLFFVYRGFISQIFKSDK